MDLATLQQMANSAANSVLAFPYLIEAIIGTVALAPFLDVFFAEIGLSSGI
ncbi:hypothetical protein SFC07_10880 [Corynebacterium callunae]|uniref:hypothetical protein n=1 Tax=Corynebacterium callunae TaxID=1721 RepID=UPI00398204FF